MDQSTYRSRQEHHKVIARVQKMPPVALVNLSQMRVKIIRSRGHVKAPKNPDDSVNHPRSTCFPNFLCFVHLL